MDDEREPEPELPGMLELLPPLELDDPPEEPEEPEEPEDEEDEDDELGELGDEGMLEEEDC